jgi:hypothetical protein
MWKKPTFWVVVLASLANCCFDVQNMHKKCVNTQIYAIALHGRIGQVHHPSSDLNLRTERGRYA